jgi:hypothetical protein
VFTLKWEPTGRYIRAKSATTAFRFLGCCELFKWLFDVAPASITWFAFSLHFGKVDVHINFEVPASSGTPTPPTNPTVPASPPYVAPPTSAAPPYARTCASVAAETRICGSTDARPVIYKTPASWLAERYDTYDCMLSMAVMRSLGIGGAKSSVNIFGSLSRPSNTAPTALLSRMGKEAVIS